MAAKPQDDGWTTVAEEAGIKVAFDKPGDVFIGVFRGMETLYDTDGEEFLAANFTGVSPDELAGEPCQLFPGWKLRNALEKVAIGQTVRVTYIKEVPMSGTGRNAMKDFRVEAKPLS